MAVRGEIAELKRQLSERDTYANTPKQYRLLSQVFELMTTGFDVSKLFNEIILLANTPDVRNKKLIYQYIISYATTHPHEALLIINTLVRDCSDSSPIIRGLALRNLSELHIRNIEEHLLPLVKKSLTDPNSYVRRVAVVSVLKLFRFRGDDYDYIERENLLGQLYALIKDEDPTVCVDCLCVLDEIEVSRPIAEEEEEEEEGLDDAIDGGQNAARGLRMTRKLVFYLLNRMDEFTAWQFCQILRFVRRFEPRNRQEVYDIMNLLDPKISLNQASVVMAIMDLFIKMTEDLPKIHSKVYQRLKSPILLLLATSNPERAFVICRHAYLICCRSPGVFLAHYKDFYVVADDPTYLKIAKTEVLERLAAVTGPRAAKEILSEFVYYVHTYEKPVAARCIRALGNVAVAYLQGTGEGVAAVNHEKAEITLGFIVQLLETPRRFIIVACFAMLKDVLRKYGSVEFVRTYLPSFVRYWELIDEDEMDSEGDFSAQEFSLKTSGSSDSSSPLILGQADNARVGLLWILGEFGELLPKSPYVLEYFIDRFDRYSNVVKHQLLNSAVQLFFKRPPEVQAMLGRLLLRASLDAQDGVAGDDAASVSTLDIRERAMYLYRLLKSDVREAERIVTGGTSDSHALVGVFTEERSTAAVDRLFHEFNTLSVVFRKTEDVFITDPRALRVLGQIVEDDLEEEEEEPKRPVRRMESDDEDEPPVILSKPVGDAARVVTQTPSVIVLSPARLSSAQYERLWNLNAPGTSKKLVLTHEIPRSIEVLAQYLSQSGLALLAKTDKLMYLYGQFSAQNGGMMVMLQVQYNIRTGELKTNFRVVEGATHTAQIRVFAQFYESLYNRYR